ncbi:MAG: 2,3-bisphosphoglycerate-independent phosphoglycerate mutase [Candidatus Sungbacteria bacterium]|uniref:2,3-bisphosphoglycerate-independent phosphoglycerate mutase n=1 Tax=Candidatus Sungiibacteriota bacterium TaxID=2750080 RepID=A0A9D6HTP3_9BACT|nr:2,3-bisphosphoglycerate-independent phosphoglycerate mutase [Candidatus Sungbacteria bacterium]
MKPVALLILDGYGIGPESVGNAIAQAKKPNLDFVEKSFPFVLLQASGVSVGLPWGEPGNSEVGHTALGTGQLWHQPLTRITQTIQNGTFFKNPVLKKAAGHAREHNSSWHLVGLIGSGSVHSFIDHLYALIEIAKGENVKEVWLHLATDGQDSPPKEAATSIQNLIERLRWVGSGKISSVIGRFYSMDRDGHWDRIEKAYRLIVQGQGEKTTDIISTLKKQYSAGQNDQYIEPIIQMDESGQPVGLIKDNDAVIFFNFREDRARQLARAVIQPDFKEFSRPELKNMFYATLVLYETGLAAEVISSAPELKYTLSQIISEHGKKQFKIAETEKYAHVTYFFNGGREAVFPGETRKLIKSVSAMHFNETPEMQAAEVSENLLTAIKSGSYDFLLANLANADIVGHTGDQTATIKAVEALDAAVGKIVNTVLETNGALIITADHGNAEEKINPLTGEINTEHTSNPVPLYLVTNSVKKAKPRSDSESTTRGKNEVKGILQDVAATVLDLLAIPPPNDMDGKSLLPSLYKQ